MDDSFAAWVNKLIPLYFYLVLMGRTLTMTLTAYVIEINDADEIYESRNLKFFYYIQSIDMCENCFIVLVFTKYISC